MYPGGFLTWYKLYKPEIAESIKPKVLAVTNIFLIIGSINPILNGKTNISVILWLIFSSIIGYNIFYHIRGLFLTKKYSPGVITSLILYLPLTVYGYFYFISEYKISIWIVFLCIAAGPFMQLFLNLNHKRRTKKLTSQQERN